MPQHYEPIQLLGRMRTVLENDQPPAVRLEGVVAIVAEYFRADVCSIYLLRAGEVLELFASEGLEVAAVHETRLLTSEGLVGLVARSGAPLSVRNAGSHPAYAYREETGEERFHGFAATPVLCGGQCVGVLVLQAVESRYFTEEELAVLGMAASGLETLLATGELVPVSEWQAALHPFTPHLRGQPLADGIGRGMALHHHAMERSHKVLAQDASDEMLRFNEALEAFQRSMDRRLQVAGEAISEEQREILESYRMFAYDRGWIGSIREAIGQGFTAEAAVRQVHEKLHDRMQAMQSAFLKERLQDLDDITLRLLQFLTTPQQEIGNERMPEACILVAKMLSAAELLYYGQERLKGLVLEEGGRSSHVVIIAKALGIPVVGGVKDALKHIPSRQPVILDGYRGEIFVRPSGEVQEAINERLLKLEARTSAYQALRDEPSVSLDGQAVSLRINAGLAIDAKRLHECGADGIGLYRTELPYMLASEFPDVASQRATYAAVFQQAGDKPVIFRSFDIGGDKGVPYIQTEWEENPALGWRATRIALDRPAMLRRQFRALIEAADGQVLRIMFPFIAEVSEFDAMQRLLDIELKRIRIGKRSKGQPKGPSAVRVGAMLEIPSLLWQLPALCERLDFLSIGSNDLLQYLYAWDRGNPVLTRRYDGLSPPFLRIVRDIVRQAEKSAVELGFCGDMASQPLEAMALLTLGVRQLSMPPSAIGPVKAMLRSLDITKTREFLEPLLEGCEHSLRHNLQAFARDHQIILE